METLYEKLHQYNKTDAYPFHMPGHKRRLFSAYTEEMYKMDITEIDDFDNLHHAEGIILEAEKRTAKLYNSEETHFLVNGSTSGILSAISAVCKNGNKILVARNCHKAVYHAIDVHQLEAVYIYPEIEEKNGIIGGLNAKKIEEVWINHPDISAIILTSPTYDGVVSDIEGICTFAHSKNIPVIVDEAHGAHFPFHDYFPESAVAHGADLVIQSTHKTLPAMTQTALLHINGQIVDRVRVRKMLAVYQSSSPSYILMGSIDTCMDLLERKGKELFEVYVRRLEKLRKELKSCKHIHLIDEKDINICYDYDCSKIVLSVSGTSLTGSEFYHILRKKYHLQMEMMSENYVLAMTSVGDDQEGFDRLANAINEIDALIDEENDNNVCRYLPVLVQKYAIFEAEWMEKESILLEQAIEHISGQYIYLYPPGIPVVAPGEVINEAMITMILRWMKQKLTVVGVENGTVLCLKE